MSGNGDGILDRALAKLAQQQAEVAKTKGFINQLLEFDGKEPMFSADEIAGAGASGAPAAAAGGSVLSIEPGQFLGKPLASAVKTILEIRKKAMEVDDLHAGLMRGNFDFGTTDKEAQKRALRISLGKNIAAFRKLPNSDMFGLTEWYGGGRTRFSRGPKSTDTAESSTGADGGEEAAGDAAAPEASEQTEGK